MPAQKYHCDYCDKQFYDTKKSRERHLQGVSHLRAKKQWFDSFRDEEDVKKQPCSFFLRTGRCQYGTECKFEHPAPPVNVQSVLHSGGVSGVGQFPAPYGATVTSPLLVVLGPGTSAPEPALSNYLMKDLPPSLRPPPEGGYPQLFPIDWG